MNERRKQIVAICALAGMFGGQLVSAGVDRARPQNGDQDRVREERRGPRTATPIKHVIVLIGENRTFDNVYGTYKPKHGQQVSNLLSKGIVNADGTPGPNRGLARQFKVGTINPVSYFISTSKLMTPNKTAYAPFLPRPEAGSAPPAAVTLAQLQKDPAPAAPPFDAHTFSAGQLHAISPVIAPGDLRLLTTGATGLANCTADPTEPPSPCAVPDTRVANGNALPTPSSRLPGRRSRMTATRVTWFTASTICGSSQTATSPTPHSPIPPGVSTIFTRSWASAGEMTRARTPWVSITCREATRLYSSASPTNTR
jgi:hypothetical protein